MRIEEYYFGEHNNDHLPHDLADQKKAGWVFLNGNVQSEWDLIHFVNNFLHNPYHGFDFQNASRKVLLVTAGFEGGAEYSDGHIRQHYYDHGIPATWNWGQTDNVENLGVAHALNEYSHSEEGHLVQEFFDFLHWMNTRSDLNAPNSELLYKIHSFLADVRSEFPSLQLYDLYYAYIDDVSAAADQYWNCIPQQQKEFRLYELDQFIQKYPHHRYYMKDLFDDLKQYDDHFFGTWQHCTQEFFDHSSLSHSGKYHYYRSYLGDRITSSASIFFWGGGWLPMLNAIKFFQLEDKFKEAQHNGSNFYGMSAGSIIMSQRIYDLSFRNSPRGYVIPHTTGIGLFDNISLYTHIQDFDYIRNKDYDIVSSLSLRTNDPVIGLVRNSVALINRPHNEIFSVGPDPVYLLDERGFYYYLNSGQHCVAK